jgi:hypothetical protein
MSRHPALSILCVTRAEEHAQPFLDALADLGARLRAELVIAADGEQAVETIRFPLLHYVVRVRSAGFIESVLDDAIAQCHGEWILRIDDDERVSPAMAAWLEAREYTRNEGEHHWSFPTANLWRPGMFIVDPPLWPDVHPRLSIRSMAGGRQAKPHAGSPHGNGTIAPVMLEHHKFLVKPFAQRQSIAARYEEARPGAGTSPKFLPFQLPELAYENARLAPLGDGSVRLWHESELETVSMRVHA